MCGAQIVCMSASASPTSLVTSGSSPAVMMRIPAADGCCASGMNISLISCRDGRTLGIVLLFTFALVQASEAGRDRKLAPRSRYSTCLGWLAAKACNYASYSLVCSILDGSLRDGRQDHCAVAC